ncbi:MAG: SPOR domain-containing protein [Rhodospirillales bacterium]|jgi:hypothetical protein
MPVRKTVVRASAVALLPMFLSGCGLPLGVQVASWAVDGISMLATEKSVSDHGISAVAQKDCALWRIFKGESICRETAASIELAAVEKLDDEDDNFEATSTKATPVSSIQVASAEPIALPAFVKTTKNDPLDDEDDNFPHIVKPSNIELAIIEMEEHQAATFETAAGSTTQPKQKTAKLRPTPLPGIKAAYNNPQVSQGEMHKAIIVADAKGGSGLIARPLPPPAPVKIQSLNRSKMKTRLLKRSQSKSLQPEPMNQQVRAKPVTNEQPVNHEPIAIPEAPKPVTSQKPKRAAKMPVFQKRQQLKRTPVIRTKTAQPKKATPGLYYVLGSFAVQKNANRMVRRAGSLSPKVVVAYPKGKRVHRVLVGPFAKSQQPRIRAKIKAANIRGFWILRMNTAMKTLGKQIAALPR